MKIHFIYFDLYTGYYASLHHGLASLAGTLKNAGHDVFLSHLTDNRDLTDLGKTIRRNNADVIALSFTTNQKRYVRIFLDTVCLADSFLIAGGVHCSLVKEAVFDEFPELHGICIGEGEIPLKTLCEKLSQRKNYFDTPNFYFKTAKGIVKNRVILFEEIDSFDLPDYSVFDYKKIITENGLTFTMMLSRGCPFDCAYCCNHALKKSYLNAAKYVRFLSPQKALKIIKHNLSLFPQTKKISFADDTFTLNQQWLFEFCEMYKKDVSLPFICNARIETVNKDILQCLKRAGCISLDYGVESGNEWLRHHILQRKYTDKKIIEAFRLTREVGIPSSSYNMVGLPFETAAMARDTFLLNKQLRPSFGKVFYFYPYPGTKLFDLCRQHGLLREDFDSVSGYLEKPSIKGVFMRHHDMSHYFGLLQAYLYMRLFLKMLKLSDIFEKPLWVLISVFHKPIMFIINPTSRNACVKRLRQVLRPVIMRHAK